MPLRVLLADDHAVVRQSHRERIGKKLEIRETAGLVRYALRHGLSAL